jgi:hypothetical protein
MVLITHIKICHRSYILSHYVSQYRHCAVMNMPTSSMLYDFPIFLPLQALHTNVIVCYKIAVMFILGVIFGWLPCTQCCQIYLQSLFVA